MNAIRPLLRRTFAQTGIRRKCDYFEPASMDELPIPCGDWHQHYASNQPRYNLHLAVGVVSMLLALLSFPVAVHNDLIYFNFEEPCLEASD